MHISDELPRVTLGAKFTNDYYDVRLKEFRLGILAKYDGFTFIKGDLADKVLIDKIFAEYKPSVVVNLAQLRRVCATALQTPMPTSTTILLAFITSWRPAVIPMIAVPAVWSIWYMHLAPASTALIKRCPIALMTRWIIL